MVTTIELKARPPLKWVGGKTQLLPAIKRRMPKSYNRYCEPFLGGGALLFNLQDKGAIASDVNEELINLYQVIKSDVSALIEELENHLYDKDYYYALRAADRSDDFKFWSPVELAARTLYLNKTCYNGLYRVNRRGQFNSPFGRHKNLTIVDKPNLMACHHALQNVELVNEDFSHIEAIAQPGDFVYFDPPYVPLEASSFTSYTRSGFDIDDQVRLRDLCLRLDTKGVNIMVSNSSSPLVVQLYEYFNIHFVYASRRINSKSENRGDVAEVLVTNY